MAANFPLEMYLDVQRQKAQNNQDMIGNMAGIGEGLGSAIGSIGEAVKQRQQKQLLDQIIQLMKQQGAPQQGPPMAPAGTPQPSMSQVPPGQPMTAGPGNIGQDVQMPQPIPTQTPGQQPMSGIGAPAQDNSQALQALLMKADPQGMIANLVAQQDPLKQAQAAWYKSRAGALGSGGPGSGKTTWYEGPDGTISKTPTEGSFPVQLSDAQGAQYTAVPKSSKDKNAAVGARAEAMQRGIDVKQIDQLVSRTGLTPKMQSQLQMNTMRALRSYIPILSRPRITYQELALGEMDLAGIMHGGVPQRDEVVNTHFPGWQEQLSKVKTYAMGHPQEVVPPDIQAKVKQMVGDVVKIDNKFLEANKKFSKTMLGPTIRGGITPGQSSAIDEMVGTLTPALGETGGGGTQSNADPLGIMK